MEAKTPLIHDAGIFCVAAHTAVGQVRKYTGEPYYEHPLEVAGIVATTNCGTEMIAAALLHDVLEDTQVTASALAGLFGDIVTNYVLELTDCFTPARFPSMNRSERKSAEARRYKSVSKGAKTIKLADMISNTTSIAQYDSKFMQVYGPEKRELLASLKGGDHGLWERAEKILTDAGY